MAKPEDAKTVMSAAAMKPLLMLSKREKVSCAIGLSKERHGMILLDKKAKPRKLASMLKKEAATNKIELDMPSVRFGHAVVDTEVDSTLVQFIVNKEAAGTLRPKLLEQLKKAGFQKCEITVDAGLEEGPEEELEEAGGHVREPLAKGENGAEAAVKARLTGLVKRMVPALTAGAPGADAMKTAAQDGQAALKAGDLKTALAAAETLERLLKGVSLADGQAHHKGKGPAMGSPVFGKAEAAWVATRRRLEAELERLNTEMQSVYKDKGVGGQLEKALRAKLEPMLAKFDHRLSHKLAELGRNADAAKHETLVGEVHTLIAQYERALASDKLIARLDDNPFVKLSIEKTLTASLSALSKVVA